MNESSQYKSVSDYYDGQSEKVKLALLDLKACILKAAPNAEEIFNYKIPAYTLIEGGKRNAQIMIAANKSSVGFYPHPTTMEKFAAELKDYKKGKGSVQFPLDKPLPKDLIVKMVKYRLNYLSKQK